MAAQLRVLRRRIRSVKSTQKITRAMQLIATARIAKAQARVEAARPYAEEIGTVLSALADASISEDSPLTIPLLAERETPRRAAVLVVTSDRGLAGGYNANVLRAAEELQSLLREQGKEPTLYVVGRKGVGYYRFRQREIVKSWTGFSEQPSYSDAADIGTTLVASFLAGADDHEAAAEVSGGDDGVQGVDELHIVYTRFVSMLTQSPTARRMAPLEVEYVDGDGDGDRRGAAGTAGGAAPGSGSNGDGRARDGLRPSFEFEPDAGALLGNLLPKYLRTRIYAALLDAAASESAARRQAMQAATDNANELIQALTREANQARQGQITQEISEIVGGAEALSAAGSEE